MSQNQNSKTYQTKLPSNERPGRTLLVKPSDNNFNVSIFNNMQGLVTNYYAEKSNSYFLTFASSLDALNGLQYIKTTSGREVRVKYAYYRIFFKLNGLSNSSNYDDVKTAHVNFIQATGANVIYYRLYKKNNSYLECGDFTVDTKESFDALINADQYGVFSFGNFTGMHYRYNKNDQQSPKQRQGLTLNNNCITE